MIVVELTPNETTSLLALLSEIRDVEDGDDLGTFELIEDLQRIKSKVAAAALGE